MSLGQLHLIECHCILPLYKQSIPRVYHKFSVYSKINEKSGNVIPKYVNCNNCGITHFVYELCRSEIKTGKEDINSVRSVEEICVSLPDNIVEILTKNKSTIDLYEKIEDILEQGVFPSKCILSRERIGEEYIIKYIVIKGKNSIKIENDVVQTAMTKGVK